MNNITKLVWEDLNKKNQLGKFSPKGKKNLTKVDMVMIQGIITSQLQLKGMGTGNPYYLAFFQLEGIDTETPVIFKLDSSSESTPPDIPPRTKVLLEGKWAQTTDSTRPSFTCLAWEIISNPSPPALKDLFKQISQLLTTSLEKQKEWQQRVDFLFKKQKDLSEIDKLSKLGSEYLQAYLLLRKAFYSNYQDNLLALNQFNQEEYLEKLAGEIEELAQHIRAYQSKEPNL